MNLGEILVTLYKVGTQIRAGLDLFDRIIVPAKEAVDLVKNDVWEDHPIKAKFVALPDEEKAKVDEPEGCGKLTTCRDFSHDQIEALVKTDEKPKPEQKQEQKPEPKPAPAAPKNKAPKTVKAEKKKPNTGAAAGKNTESSTEEKPEDVKQNDDQSGTGEDGDNGDGSKD